MFLLLPDCEKKFDHIDRRLDAVMEMLTEVKNSIPARSNTETKKTPHLSSDQTTAFESADHVAESESDPTMSIHSALAHEFFKKTTTNNPSANYDEGLSELSGALENYVTSVKPSAAIDDYSYPRARISQQQVLQACELPPIGDVMRLIRDSSNQDTVKSILIFNFFPNGAFSDLCLNVYFSKDFTPTNFLAVNVGLYYLLRESSFVMAGLEASQLLRSAKLCRRNIDIALASLPLYLPKTSETVVSLFCGMHYAIDDSKPDLAWTLMRLVQILSKLALRYVETRRNALDLDGTNLNAATNHYMSLLGFSKAGSVAEHDHDQAHAPFLSEPLNNDGTSQQILNPMMWLDTFSQHDEWLIDPEQRD
ncbi:hypothetical protein HJFPF1_10839 [Paramyrothecium foliicola]|nr:hypothetical protein HJFPF1_10839 [Paramyrothecium foliicola]